MKVVSGRTHAQKLLESTEVWLVFLRKIVPLQWICTASRGICLPALIKLGSFALSRHPPRGPTQYFSSTRRNTASTRACGRALKLQPRGSIKNIADLVWPLDLGDRHWVVMSAVSGWNAGYEFVSLGNPLSQGVPFPSKGLKRAPYCPLRRFNSAGPHNCS